MKKSDHVTLNSDLEEAIMKTKMVTEEGMDLRTEVDELIIQFDKIYNHHPAKSFLNILSLTAKGRRVSCYVYTLLIYLYRMR